MAAALALALAATAYRGPLPARLAAHPRTRASSPLLVETDTKKGSCAGVENVAHKAKAGQIGRGCPAARWRPELPANTLVKLAGAHSGRSLLGLVLLLRLRQRPCSYPPFGRWSRWVG